MEKELFAYVKVSRNGVIYAGVSPYGEETIRYVAELHGETIIDLVKVDSEGRGCVVTTDIEINRIVYNYEQEAES